MLMLDIAILLNSSPVSMNLELAIFQDICLVLLYIFSILSPLYIFSIYLFLRTETPNLTSVCHLYCPLAPSYCAITDF